MAFLIYDIESKQVTTQLDYDPSVDNPKYLEHRKVFAGKDINFDEDLLCCYELNAAGDDLVNPYAGKTKAEMMTLHDAAKKLKTAKQMKGQKLLEVKTSTALKLEDEYSPAGWRHEKASETDLLNGNNDAMTKLAQEKKAIRDAGNAHEATLAALDPDTDAGAAAIIAFDATTSGF
tara:strand:- start:44 stop:571 length:528 start_codon:yes stop_codon:yes gene_type:complete